MITMTTAFIIGAVCFVAGYALGAERMLNTFDKIIKGK